MVGQLTPSLTMLSPGSDKVACEDCVLRGIAQWVFTIHACLIDSSCIFHGTHPEMLQQSLLSFDWGVAHGAFVVLLAHTVLLFEAGVVYSSNPLLICSNQPELVVHLMLPSTVGWLDVIYVLLEPPCGGQHLSSQCHAEG